MAIDERQIADNQKSIEKLIFTVGAERGRIRGSKTGGLAPTFCFKNILLSTSEEPIIKSSSTTGVATRCLELYDTGFASEEEAAKIYKIASKHYGIAGKLFVQKLIDTYAQNDYKELIQMFEDIREELDKGSNCDVSSYITSVAVITLADILLSNWIFEEDSENEAIYVAQDILVNKLGKANDIDVTEKAYEYIKNYIISNHSRFNCYNRDPKYLEDDIYGCSNNSLGIYDRNIYYIFPNALEDFLTNKGFSYHKTLRELAQKNYILYEKYEDGTFKSSLIQKKYRNKNVRMIAFPMAEADKEAGGKDYD